MAVRIAVVADTHLPRFGRSLPEPLKTGFADAGIDRAIHCGDWVEPFVVDLFEAVAPVDGVAGNNDPPELIERFGLTSVLDVDGVRIGITHGHVGPTRLTTLERARLAFATEPEMAAICFGHSHIPSITRLPGGPLLVNPGSPTDKRRQRLLLGAPHGRAQTRGCRAPLLRSLRVTIFGSNVSSGSFASSSSGRGPSS